MRAQSAPRDILSKPPRQFFHQRQPPARPALAAPHRRRGLAKIPLPNPIKLIDKPAVLDGVVALPACRTVGRRQRLWRSHLPDHGLDRVAPQPSQSPHALMTIHHNEPPLDLHHHDDRVLLAVLIKRRQQLPLAPPIPHTQTTVALVQCLQVQLHRLHAHRFTFPPSACRLIPLLRNRRPFLSTRSRFMIPTLRNNPIADAATLALAACCRTPHRKDVSRDNDANSWETLSPRRADRDSHHCATQHHAAASKPGSTSVSTCGGNLFSRMSVAGLSGQDRAYTIAGKIRIAV